MINKFQQGGKQQDAIMQFVQGLAQVLQVKPEQVIQVAQQNPKALESAVQVYQQTQDMNQAAQAFTQSIKKAKQGAKLQYLKSLKRQCADDEELYYYKKGGSVGCGCKKKEDGGEVVKAQDGVVAKFKEEKRKKKQQTSQQKEKPKVSGEYIKNFKNNYEGQKQSNEDAINGTYGMNQKQIEKYNKQQQNKQKIKKDGKGAVAKFKKAFKKGGSLNRSFFN